MGASLTVGGMEFTGAGWGVASSNGAVLTLNNLTSTPFISTDTGATATITAPMGGSTGLNKTGAGTLTLFASSTFTGQMDVQAGTLAYGAANVLADGATLRVSGGMLSLGGHNDTVAGVTLASGTIAGPGTLTSTSAFNMQSGTVSAALGGSVGLVKSGTGNLNLTGGNTYTGPTLVNSGTLSLSGSIASTAGTTVASGATLTGTGTLSGPVTVSDGGIIAGDLKLTGVTTFAGTGNYNASLTTVGGVGGAPVGESSRLDLTAVAEPSIATGFKINVTGSPGTFTQPGIYRWLVMAVSSVDSLNWAGMQIGSVSFGSSTDFSIFTVDNSSGTDYIGVSYSYSAVPEATTLLLGMAGLTPVLLQRRGRPISRRLTAEPSH